MVALSAKPVGAPAQVQLVIGAAYFLTAKLCLYLSATGTQASHIWIPAGVAMIATITWGYRVLPAIFVAAFLSNVTWVDANPFVLGLPDSLKIAESVMIASGNTVEAGLVRFLFDRVSVMRRVACDEPVSSLGVWMLSALLGCLVSASNGAYWLVTSGTVPIERFARLWLDWWAGDFLGCVVGMGILSFRPMRGILLLISQEGEASDSGVDYGHPAGCARVRCHLWNQCGRLGKLVQDLRRVDGSDREARGTTASSVA